MIATFILDQIVFDQAYLSCVSLTPGAIRNKLYERIQSAAVRPAAERVSWAVRAPVVKSSHKGLEPPGTLLLSLGGSQTQDFF